MRKAVGKIAALIISVRLIEANPPLFLEEPTYGEKITALHAINNSGDLLVNANIENGTAYNDGPVLVRDAQGYSLYPVGTPNVNSVMATGLSERRADGGIYIAGTAVMKDQFWRACLWDIAADGSIRSFRAMPNIILPEDSLAPGEQSRSYGSAVSTAGILVGSAQSYLAGLATIWRPPYDRAVRYLLSTGSEFAFIREDELLGANGVEFEHGGARNRYAAAVLHEGGIPREVPHLSAPVGLYPSRIESMRGDWVAGSSSGELGQRSFVWKIGTAASIELPVPAALPGGEVESARAWSISSSGDAVGMMNGGRYGGVPIFWRNEGGPIVAHDFNELIADGNRNYRVEQGLFINDAGQVAFVQRDWQGAKLKLFTPLTNGVITMAESAWAREGEAVEFKVTLRRAPGNTGGVSVAYRTEDESARSPRDFIGQSGTITWGPAESGEKSVFIKTVDNDTLNPGDGGFKFLLSNSAGARLGAVREAHGYVFEEWQQFFARNQMAVDLWSQGIAVRRGESEAIIKVERAGNSDGSITFTNFTFGSFSSAQAGVDYTIPEGLSLSWGRGDTNIKVLRIPLLNPVGSVAEPRNFFLSASGKFDDSEMEASFTATVFIQPNAQNAPPYLDAAAMEKGPEGLSLKIAAMQGTTVQLERAGADLTTWTNVAEGRSIDGEVYLRIPWIEGQKAEFYRASVKN